MTAVSVLMTLTNRHVALIAVVHHYRQKFVERFPRQGLRSLSCTNHNDTNNEDHVMKKLSPKYGNTWIVNVFCCLITLLEVRQVAKYKTTTTVCLFNLMVSAETFFSIFCFLF